MTDFLTKIFVKDYNSPELPEVREKYGTFSSVVGVIVNVLLATLKLIAGILSGSIAIIADSLNNYSDAGSSIISFISFKIAAKPADKGHPFGHARIEYVCSMIVSFLILLVGVELFTESFSGLFDKEGAKNTVTALTYIILAISIVFKLWLSLFYRKIAKKINSSVINASATDSISDVISTAAVLVSSIIMNYTDLWFTDSLVGIAVSVMIIIAGVKILNETKNSLLGEPPVKEVVDSIKEVVGRYPEIIGIHDMLVHNYGPNHYFASFHAEVDGKGDVFLLHDAIDNIEKDIYNEHGILCTIHMDPISTDDEEVNKLRAFTEEVVKTVCGAASIHDFRTVVGKTHTNLIFDVVLPFEMKDTEQVISCIEKNVSEVYPNYYCVITVDRD